MHSTGARASRAPVSLLAGGDVAQAITGAGVTNGNTANATLTLGNVRVGSTTFNYQIANTGTTGPSLRGAIQTTVNGGSLTDGRLTGSGVRPATTTPAARAATPATSASPSPSPAPARWRRSAARC